MTLLLAPVRFSVTSNAAIIPLHVDEDFTDTLDAHDAYGLKIERLQETYNGIDVHDGIVTVKVDGNGELTGDATGTLYQNIDEDLPKTEPIFNDIDTLNIAVAAEGDGLKDVRNVKYKREIYMNDDGKAHLVNIVSYRIGGIKRPFYVIDLHDGGIIRHWQGLTTNACPNRESYNAIGGNTKMGVIKYGETPYCLAPTIKDGVCYLENEYVRVVDMKATLDESIGQTASFYCKNGYRDPINGAYSPALDAFFYGTVMGKMFEEWFQSQPLHEKIELRVHYGQNLTEAFWDGTMCFFGDGYDVVYPLVVLDVVGHEVGHGVTEANSRLMYSGESGGIDEAFADILGETAEGYLAESDFFLGAYIMKNRPYLREFHHPENDHYSISHVEQMKEDTDPHYSSGIYRRVWYILVKEKNMRSRDVTYIFLFANRMYWHSTATFYDASCGILQAAIDLGFPTEPFRLAFSDVGITECDVTSHIFHLNNGKKQMEIIVSKTETPTFSIEIPERVKELSVKIHGKPRDKVRITVRKDGWEDDARGGVNAGTVVAKGSETVKVRELSSGTYFITLSLSKVVKKDKPKTKLNVDMTVEYGY